MTDQQGVRRTLICVVGLLMLAAARLAVAAPFASFHKEPRPFLEQYCVKCHAVEMQEGDIRLDNLTEDFTLDGTRWAVVLDLVRRGEMPPRDAKPQPTVARKKELIAWVSGQLGAHAQRKPNLGNLVLNILAEDKDIFRQLLATPRPIHF